MYTKADAKGTHPSILSLLLRFPIFKNGKVAQKTASFRTALSYDMRPNV